MNDDHFLKRLFRILSRIYANIMFWGWNMLFLFLTIFLIIPYVFIPLIQSTFTGGTPPIFLIFTTLIIILVFGSIGVGVFLKLKEKYIKWEHTALHYIFAFFYGVEVPIVLLMLYRIFLVRLLTPAMTMIMIAAFITIAVYVYHLYRSFNNIKITPKWFNIVLGVVPLITSTYLSLFLLFYVAPPIHWLIETIPDIDIATIFYVDNLFELLQFSIIVSIITFSIGVFATFPVVFLFLNIRASIIDLKVYIKELGAKRVALTSLSTVILIIIMAAILNIQNQNKYLDLSNLLDSELSKEDIQNVIKNEKSIKRNLTSIYLASYKYLSSTGTCSHINYMYENISDNEELAESIQNIYNFIATPFLYKGESFVEDKEKALKIYESLFDEPMQKVQKKKIKKALTATWNRDEAKAGLLDIDEEVVLLKKQNLDIKESGNFAEIELYEMYQNTTTDQQEIFYYFTLPANAVVTGLWLGQSDNKEMADKYVVSPRGAAQEVYNNQVRVRRDPALIEKVGPMQYRLRAFPIPGNDRFDISEKGELHLWMTYAAMRNSDGAWPVPELREKRNIFWNKKTAREFSDLHFNYKDTESWLPVSKKVESLSENVNVKIDDSTFVTFMPMDENIKSIDNYSNKRTALIIDRSRSMDEYKDALKSEYKNFIEKNGKNNLDVYLGGYKFQKVDDVRFFDIESILFFGSTSLLEEVNKFKQLGNEDDYDQVVILSDDGGYELSDDETLEVNFSIPVHIIHVANDLPPAYTDNLLETLRKNRGIIAGSVDEFYKKQFSRISINRSDEILSIDNGYKIIKSDKEKGIVINSDPAISLAANYLLEQEIFKNDMTKLTNLDFVHNLAKKYSLVTQYSSMIVLVNDWQREQLKRAEARNDRFKREAEVGKEELSVPLGADVSGVPEPHEWMLLITIFMFGVYTFYSKKSKSKVII